MPKTLLRRLVQSRKGSVMVETALMITILLVLMFGIVDLGRALFTANNLTSAAREGARWAAVQPPGLDTNAVKTQVINHFSPFGGPALTNANIATTFTGIADDQSRALRVTVKYRFTWITPIRALVGNMADTLHAQAEYHLENQ
jgi:Flp pilus assembly protein TadG